LFLCSVISLEGRVEFMRHLHLFFCLLVRLHRQHFPLCLQHPNGSKTMYTLISFGLSGHIR
jgi:hypothetical protein